MSWKKFPSQGLVSLSSTPTLTDVWVPRWSNTFGTDILPIETPALLTGLPADDKENLLDETFVFCFAYFRLLLEFYDFYILCRDQDNMSTISKEAKIYLTPEMVNVQFNIPDLFEGRERNIKEE